MPVSTCRMAHLSLPNSELHIGLGAEGNARLEAVARAPGTAVLFPGEGAVDARELATPIETLVVLDGTWSNARKLVQRSPLLRGLPRVALAPDRPGNYRIRREPAAHCLATIEAVVQVLELLERAPGRFAPMLAAFDRMVEFQLGHAVRGDETTRYHRSRHNRPPHDVAGRLRAAADRLVLAYGEGNWWPEDSAVTGAAELLQWVAVKPASGERFEAVLAPRRPLGPRVPQHLGLPIGAFTNGESVAAFLERWRAFRGDDGVLVTWGVLTREMLASEGAALDEWIDLKHVASQALCAPSGGAEHLATRLGAMLDTSAVRAARRLGAMEAVAATLIASGTLHGAAARP